MIYQDTADMLAHQKPDSYVYGTNLEISADHGHVILNYPPMFGMIAFAPSLRDKNRKFVPCKCRNPNWPEWTKAVDVNRLQYATTYHEAVLLYDQLITKERLWHEHESEISTSAKPPDSPKPKKYTAQAPAQTPMAYTESTG